MQVLIEISMLRIIFLVLFISFNESIYSQIDLNEYKEPDGSLLRIRFDPLFNYNANTNSLGNSSSTFSTLRWRLSNTSSFNKVTELSKTSFLINASYDENRFKDSAGSTTSRPVFDLSSEFYTKKYLKKRNGVFIQVLNTVNYQRENQFRIRQADLGLSFGIGRMEDVSGLYQATRINRQLNENQLHNKNDLFDLADEIKIAQYNRTIHDRFRRIENHAALLSGMQTIGYKLDDFYTIANAIDALQYEKVEKLESGYEIKVGLNERYLFTNKRFGLQLHALAAYKRMISEFFYGGVTIGVEQNLKGGLAKLYYTRLLFSYLPSNRTTINLALDYNYLGQNKPLSLYRELSLDFRYFISSKLSVSMEMELIKNRVADFRTDKTIWIRGGVSAHIF